MIKDRRIGSLEAEIMEQEKKILDLNLKVNHKDIDRQEKEQERQYGLDLSGGGCMPRMVKRESEMSFGGTISVLKKEKKDLE